jgi:hypothetical protein
VYIVSRAILVALTSFAALARADVTVVEYHHSGYDHYFVTPVPDEIAKLDARVAPFELWSRTGRTFRALENNAARAGAVDICRLFNDSFGLRSSHFYAPRALGCEETLARFPDWRLEDDKLFAAMLPDAAGTCPAGTVALYRLYNQGRNGAPNHRLVTSLADRQEMLDKGYLAEGAGIGVGMCVPEAAGGRTTAEGLWRGTISTGKPAWLLVLGDRRFYLVHGDPSPQVGTGIVTGTFTYADGTVGATDVLHVPLTTALPGAEGFPLQGTLLPGDALQLSQGALSLTASYDPAYDGPAELAALAGAYTGASGHLYELGPPGSARTTIDAQGNIDIRGAQCDLSGKLAPRAKGNLFEGTLQGRGTCAAFTALHTFVLYDPATRTLSALSVVFRNPYTGSQDVYAMFATRN